MEKIETVVNRKRNSELEKFAEQATGFIDAIVHGENKKYLATRRIGKFESYLELYINESKEIKELDLDDELQDDDPLKERKREEYDEEKHFSKVYMEYLKEQKQDRVMTYLRKNLSYNLAKELMAFALNPEKKLNPCEKIERLTMIGFLDFKGGLKNYLDKK